MCARGRFCARGYHEHQCPSLPLPSTKGEQTVRCCTAPCSSASPAVRMWHGGMVLRLMRKEKGRVSQSKGTNHTEGLYPNDGPLPARDSKEAQRRATPCACRWAVHAHAPKRGAPRQRARTRPLVGQRSTGATQWLRRARRPAVKSRTPRDKLLHFPRQQVGKSKMVGLGEVPLLSRIIRGHDRPQQNRPPPP